MLCFEQLPTLSEARKLGAGTGKDAWGQESQAVEQGLGGPGGRVFLEYLLPFQYLVARLDTSPPCPKPHHPNSLPSPLQAQPKDQGPDPLPLSKPSRSCQSGADRAKYTHSQYCGVRAGLEEGSILLSLEK